MDSQREISHRLFAVLFFFFLALLHRVLHYLLKKMKRARALAIRGCEGRSKWALTTQEVYNYTMYTKII